MTGKKLYALILAPIFINSISVAQPSLQKMQQKLSASKQNTAQSFYRFEVTSKMKNQGSILFSPDMAIPKANLQAWLADKLELRPGADAFIQRQPATIYAGTQITKLQQYYKGIKVEHGVIAEVDTKNSVRLLQMEFYPISGELAVVPVLLQDAALQKAMDFVGAQQYVWENNPENLPDLQKPQAELVIVEDVFNSVKEKMCLAYKFNVFAALPGSRQYIYVDAVTGNVVFTDVIIKHMDGEKNVHPHKKISSGILSQKQQMVKGKAATINNTRGQILNPASIATYEQALGFTKYSGDQYFTTEKVNPNLYRLRAQRTINNTVYETYNFNHKLTTSVNPAVDVTDFTDNNNTWDESSYLDDTTNAALDIHWGTEQVIDYWWNIHNRKSYDNNNGRIVNYYHYGVRFGGAFWNSQLKCMFYGDGSQNGEGFNAVASLDVVAHELGHGICDFTAGLVYKRESGALNEGFSDIWAACIDNYANKTFPSVSKVPFLILDEVVETAGRNSLRDMTDPKKWGQPDSYMDIDNYWFDVNVENCPIPIDKDEPMGNDFCGVHINSGVLNKWFYLITKGGTMTNMNGQIYTIDSMGFEKTERIAYYTEMILTPNSGFEAARIASLNAIQILATDFNNGGVEIADTTNIIKAWKAVGVLTDSIYNKLNTPVFDTSLFTSIAIGKYGYIWAGTANRGLYKYNGRVWQKAPVLLNHNIADIKADKNGGIWIAQFGRSGAQALNGGINYFPDSSFKFKQFSTAEGVPTRNVRSLFIDDYLPINTTAITDTFKRVWAACFSDITGSTVRNGNAMRGLPSPVTDTLKYFKKILNVDKQAITYCQTIAGNKDEVWVYVSMSTPDTNKIIRYRRTDTAYLGALDITNSPLPKNFIIKAMFYDPVNKKWWLGMSTGGLYTYTPAGSSWNQINFPTIFPAGTIVNNNAITGDTRGNIYIGTNKGYVFFGSPNSSVVLNPLDVSQYKLLTMADGLPANNVKGIAIDYRSSRIVIATDSGIVFKYLLCKECVNTGPAYSILPGNWVNPGIWAGGKVPGINSNVIIKHAVIITSDANCNSLKLEGSGKITVNAGVNLTIEGLKYEKAEW